MCFISLNEYSKKKLVCHKISSLVLIMMIVLLHATLSRSILLTILVSFWRPSCVAWCWLDGLVRFLIMWLLIWWSRPLTLFVLIALFPWYMPWWWLMIVIFLKLMLLLIVVCLLTIIVILVSLLCLRVVAIVIMLIPFLAVHFTRRWIGYSLWILNGRVLLLLLNKSLRFNLDSLIVDVLQIAF